MKIKTDKKEEKPIGGDTMNNQMPPMDSQQPMNNQMPPMDNQMGDMQGEEQFDSNFDAGVEEDENNDPKRYIQQLAGKLSQSLRKYNENLPNPDADLNKYVAGMTNDAAVEGLTPDDVEEIIGKIKSDETTDTEKQDDQQNNIDLNTQMDNNQNQQPMDSQMPPMENKKNNKKLTENLQNCIDEIINDVITKKQDNSNKINVKNSFKTKPYSSPSFK